jgi:hypothetical protein
MTQRREREGKRTRLEDFIFGEQRKGAQQANSRKSYKVR